MDIESAIVARLKASQALTALCNGRVYPLLMPDTANDPPCLTYQRISETPDSTLDGPGSTGELRLQIDCWSPVHSVTSSLDNAVSIAINGLRATVSGVTFCNIMRDGSQDLYEPDTKLYRRSVDYKIQFAV